ncbi:hypothetical protein K470DRAFT_197683, partial [Piedraia hortae CBS 480.64]
RLGHVGTMILSRTKQVAVGLEGLDLSELAHCEPCHLGKAQRVVSRKPQPKPKAPLDKIHVDTVGPVEHDTLQQHRWIFILTDANGRFR